MDKLRGCGRLLLVLCVMMLGACGEGTTVPFEEVHADVVEPERGTCYSVGETFTYLVVCEDFVHRVVCYWKGDAGMVCFRMMDSDLQGDVACTK